MNDNFDTTEIVIGWLVTGLLLVFTWTWQCNTNDVHYKNANELEDRVIRLEALHEAESKR